MKPYPRIRKTVKWAGAVVTLLLLVVWIASGWMVCTRPLGQTRMLVFGHGRLTVFQPVNGAVGETGWRDSTNRYPTGAEWERFSLRWRFEFGGNSCSYGGPTWLGSAITVPAWTLVAAALGVSGLAWRLDTLACRRARLNLCTMCNYDRTGLAAGAVCPECGGRRRMKSHPRIRKTVKWGGAVATVLLTVVWLGSAWRTPVWMGPGRWSVSLDGGAITGGPSAYTEASVGLGGGLVDRVLGKLSERFLPPPPPRRGVVWADGRRSIYWLPRWGSSPAGGWWVLTPLWPAVLFAFGATIFAWRRDARALRRLRGACENCNYDRTGLAAGAVCPECGAAAT